MDSRITLATACILVIYGRITMADVEYRNCVYAHHSEIIKDISSVAAEAFDLDERTPVKRREQPGPDSSDDSFKKVKNRHGEVLLQEDNKTEICAKSSDFCYTLWRTEGGNKTEITILAQGCWEGSGEFQCRQNECVSDARPMKKMNNTRFCCCEGSQCNEVYTETPYVNALEEQPSLEPAFMYVEKARTQQLEVVSVLLLFAAVLLVLSVSCLVAWRKLTLRGGRIKKQPSDSLNLIEAGNNSPLVDWSTLKLQDVIGRGRYATVWKAGLSEQTVAVKVFGSSYRHFYMNERDCYTLPHMDHPNLLKYFGSEERLDHEGRKEFCLVLSYAPLGSLLDYLRGHTVDWATMCKMAHGVTKGLSHLHTDIRKGDRSKPCVCHRDINSRNVLVKPDLSCCICDLGFAMKINGAKYYVQSGEEQHAETTSLSDVGTLRYMAPEVLEGAVNLRDCESSLKQIDVYALGLVLWEAASRCVDMFQGMDVPEYKLPFEAEIGQHPTFEQMQVLVSRNKARPLFPEVWKDTNQAVRLLKETIEDCWDQDAEARLTPLCVEERILELPALWNRHKGYIMTSVSPTINPMSTAPVVYPPPYSATDRNLLSNPENNKKFSSRDSSVSNTTMDTILSPSVEGEQLHNIFVVPKNANCQQQQHVNLGFKYPVQLQPYQGRNPCIARNTASESNDNFAYSGNLILNKSQLKIENSQQVASTLPYVEDLLEMLQHAVDPGESDSLVNHDFSAPGSVLPNHVTGAPLPRITSNNISFVQNAVHETQPKQMNVEAVNPKKRGWIKSILGRGKIPVRVKEGEGTRPSKRQNIDGKCNLNRVETEVCFVGRGGSVTRPLVESVPRDVRPNTLDVSGSPVVVKERVKTPFREIKTGRFSLYSDRVMAGEGGEEGQGGRGEPKLSISVPIDIDSICEGEGAAARNSDFDKEHTK